MSELSTDVRRPRSRAIVVGLVAWLVIGFAIAGVTRGFSSGDRHLGSRLQAHGVSTRAKVTDFDSDYAVIYTYAVGRMSHTGTTTDSGPEGDYQQLRIGQAIHVVYDSEAPEVSCYCDVSSLAAEGGWSGALFEGFALSTLVLSFGAVRFAVRHRRGPRWLWA